MEKNNRLLCVMKYLWTQTDETHPVSITDIQNHLNSLGIPTHRKTIPGDLERLREFGLDIVCNKSNKNLYFIGDRVFELPELKLLIDAVQSCRFIAAKKSVTLTRKLTALASAHQADSLNRHLLMENRIKTNNTYVYFAIDALNTAINEKKQMRFQYYEYLPSKKKVLKHDGRVYEFSPYDLVWRNDSYYAIGYSVSHGKVIKFRVDRMCKPVLCEIAAVPRPDDYDLLAYICKVFQMYDEQIYTVELLCENKLMNSVIDRFSEKVRTHIVDKEHFAATVEVSVSPTFFSWVFTFGGKMKILSPESVSNKYRDMANAVLQD